MLSTLEINGKKLSPIKEAVLVTKYSRDYVTRLAREGKIVASLIGRQWFVDVDSLRSYAESISLEQEVRNRQLSEERRRERQLREVVEEQRTQQRKRANTLSRRSLVAASLVLCSGLVGGTVVYQTHSFPSLSDTTLTQLTLSPQAELMPAQTSGATQSSPESLDQGRQSSSDVRSMGEISEGVLLLPNSGSVDDVAELFSDVVEVRKTVDGEETVVMVDATGDPIGEEVPFVVVPVTEVKR
jgi:hypothetical protein